MQKIFISGTDTDIGKTVVSAWIAMHSNAKYWKPIQTGDDSDSITVKTISPKTFVIPEIYKLKMPLSPYDAAKYENVFIDSTLFLQKENNVIIEGAGGVAVPITDSLLMLDVAKINNAPMIIVAKSKIGIINHIFLTVNFVRAYGVKILGVVIIGDIEENIKNTIQKFANIEILNVIPVCLNPENLSDMLASLKPSEQILEIFKK